MVVRVDNVTVRFGGFKALDSLSCRFEPATMNGLIGPNGAGKTTLLNVLSGLCQAVEGEILLSDELAPRSPQGLFRHGVSRTFQIPRLYPSMTVRDNVVIGLPRQPIRFSPRPRFPWKASRRLDRTRELAQDWLDRCRAGRLGDKLAGELTLHEQRMAELTRALASAPKVLMLDEPTSGLGAWESNELLEVAREVAGAEANIILVSHDMQLVSSYVQDNVVVLDRGTCLDQGPATDVFTSEKVRAAYLGEET
jgi:branched-chain amino acid transport system ATP-binding protein